MKMKKPSGNGRSKGVENMKEPFELRMDHPSLIGAKMAMDTDRKSVV